MFFNYYNPKPINSKSQYVYLISKTMKIQIYIRLTEYSEGYGLALCEVLTKGTKMQFAGASVPFILCILHFLFLLLLLSFWMDSKAEREESRGGRSCSRRLFVTTFYVSPSHPLIFSLLFPSVPPSLLSPQSKKNLSFNVTFTRKH